MGTLPTVTLDTDSGAVLVSSKDRTKLQMNVSPVSTTLAVFNSSANSSPYLLSDPTCEEEQLASSLVTVVTTGGGVCHLHQPGGEQLSPQLLQQSVELATQRAKLVAGRI